MYEWVDINVGDITMNEDCLQRFWENSLLEVFADKQTSRN